MTIFNPNVADRSDTTFFLGPLGDNGAEKALTTPSPYKKDFVTGATVAANRIVKYGTAPAVIVGAAATDLLLGVSTNTEDAVSGANIDVIMSGEATVVAGAAVAVGALVTSDGTGRAVTAAATNRSVGVALTAAANAGDTITVFVSLCTA